uniref:Uncharacterized protein n=1 Tax=Anopheles coluzzii TaxID=1518534 RepID=A0A8W7Q3G6_ANOCL
MDVTVFSQYQHTRTYLFGTTFDYCEYMSSTESYHNPVAKLVYAVAKLKFPQALLQCPASGVVNLKRFQCIDHPYEISKLHYCHMETLRNGSQVLGVILEFLNSLQKVNVAGGLYIQYFRTRTPLLATTMEYCQQNKDILSIKNPVNKFALDYAQKHLPQLLTDCPIRKGKVFNITGLLVDDRLIPSFVIRLLTRRNEPQVVDVMLDILEPTSKLLIIFNLYTQYFQTKNLLYGTTFEYCDLTKNVNTQINPVTRIAINLARENFPQVLKQCPLYGLVNVTGLEVNSRLQFSMIKYEVTPRVFFTVAKDCTF